MVNCPECVARERKKIQEKYAEDAEVNVTELIEKIEVPMKFDITTKHFICKLCGLYATREQVGDIRAKLNQREYTKEDRHYDYQEWWTKSKKEKQRT